MNIDKVILKCVAVKKSQYPMDIKKEIAFVGKSNVGKSSLINTMINRKSLARTSQNPGKTRTINFYEVMDKFYFVDLPGYGYAKAPKSEQKKWGDMVESYLLKRPQLSLIIFLVDIRHPPSENDKMMFDFIKYYDYNTVVVLTKSDKLSKNQLYKNISLIKKSLNLTENDKVVPFSSLKKEGRDELFDIILEHI